MGRPIKADTMMRVFADSLRSSMTEADFTELPTLQLATNLVNLLLSKDTSKLTKELIQLLESRDLTEIPAAMRLDLMTRLMIRGKLPPEENMTLVELKQVREGRISQSQPLTVKVVKEVL
jgi:hypothetical protein